MAKRITAGTAVSASARVEAPSCLNTTRVHQMAWVCELFRICGGSTEPRCPCGCAEVARRLGADTADRAAMHPRQFDRTRRSVQACTVADCSHRGIGY